MYLTAVFYHLQDVVNLNLHVSIRRNRSLKYETHTNTKTLTQTQTHSHKHTHTHTRHNDMAQADSRWPEARVQLQARSCGIYDSSGTRTGFSPSISFFPCLYHSTSAPYSCINHRHHIMSATAASLNSIHYLKTHTRVNGFVTHIRCLYCA